MSDSSGTKRTMAAVGNSSQSSGVTKHVRDVNTIRCAVPNVRCSIAAMLWGGKTNTHEPSVNVTTARPDASTSTTPEPDRKKLRLSDLPNVVDGVKVGFHFWIFHLLARPVLLRQRDLAKGIASQAFIGNTRRLNDSCVDMPLKVKGDSHKK